MHSPDRVDFRLPGAVVRRALVLHTLVIVGALLLYHLLTRQSSLGPLAGAAAVAVLALATGYAATARRVWLTMSPAGLWTTTYLGRRVELAWTTPVTVSAARQSGQKGHVLFEQGAGLLNSRLNGLFVPLAISAGAEFKGRVAEWAPPGHPLRTIAADAARQVARTPTRR